MRSLRNGSWRSFLLAAVTLAALDGSADAQISGAQQNALKQSCRSDFMSHCAGVTPGGQEALACLQKNVAGLSMSEIWLKGKFGDVTDPETLRGLIHFQQSL